MREPSSHDELTLVLDANAVASTLERIFGRDVTTGLAVCNHCGHGAAIGTLRAYTRGPGAVLRCSRCEQIVMRFTTTDSGAYVDLRGAACMRLV